MPRLPPSALEPPTNSLYEPQRGNQQYGERTVFHDPLFDRIFLSQYQHWRSHKNDSGHCPNSTPIKKNDKVLKNIRAPVRPHFGTLGLAPAEVDMVTSIPPSYTGGNIDNWRIGVSADVKLTQPDDLERVTWRGRAATKGGAIKSRYLE